MIFCIHQFRLGTRRIMHRFRGYFFLYALLLSLVLLTLSAKNSRHLSKFLIISMKLTLLSSSLIITVSFIIISIIFSLILIVTDTCMIVYLSFILSLYLIEKNLDFFPSLINTGTIDLTTAKDAVS